MAHVSKPAGTAGEFISERAASQLLGLGKVAARKVLLHGGVRVYAPPGVAPRYRRDDIVALIERSVTTASA